MDGVGAPGGCPGDEDGDDLRRLRAGRLGRFLPASTVVAGEDDAGFPDGSADTLLAACRLQHMVEYRAALQAWFAAVRTGGHLIVIVPHALAEGRQPVLPVPDRPRQRRLYTPAQLMSEIEEALVPGSYRISLLCDGDGTDAGDRGDGDTISVVLEKMALPFPAPADGDAAPSRPLPHPFTPAVTRLERALPRPHERILVLKLDHLGDFILGLPALERVRALFPQAHITLVVGSWNVELARSTALADEVLNFDAFPRNSSEEEVDVPGKRGLFDAAIRDSYDLAIDLRSDGDTRTLLARVRAPVKAGMGDRSHYPFLDIALPIDADRGWREQAREDRFDHRDFSSQDGVERLHHRLVVSADRVQRNSAIIWGPYRRLRPGRYLFDPAIEFADGGEGLLMIDVGLNTRRVARRYVQRGDPLWLPFDVEEPDSAFEFRIWPLEETPPIGLSFYGGRLVREGVNGTLHQSDYLVLLVELVARRVKQLGLLTSVAP